MPPLWDKASWPCAHVLRSKLYKWTATARGQNLHTSEGSSSNPEALPAAVRRQATSSSQSVGTSSTGMQMSDCRKCTKCCLQVVHCSSSEARCPPSIWPKKVTHRFKATSAVLQNSPRSSWTRGKGAMPCLNLFEGPLKGRSIFCMVDAGVAGVICCKISWGFCCRLCWTALRNVVVTTAN